MAIVGLFFLIVALSVFAVIAHIFIEVFGAIFGVIGAFLEALFGGSGSSPGPMPRHVPSRQESRYTSDWSSVSRNYKRSRRWTCEVCGVYCGGHDTHKTLLHVHHLDLDPQNNSAWNLAALCVQCHGSMEGVGHKRLASAAKTDGRWDAVDHLRWRQGR